MINFIENNNFFRHEKEIVAFMTDNTDDYFVSPCYRGLRKRFDRLNESIDMAYSRGNRSSNTNTWQAKIAVPLVLEKVISRKATLSANFRSDPLLSVMPCGATPYENAIRAQQVLDSNIRITRFRERCFDRIQTDVSRYGSSVAFSMLDKSLKKVPKTVEMQSGEISQVMMPRHRTCILNIPIHVLNYFQNPHVADPNESNFRGFKRRMFLSDLMALVKNADGRYIQKNLYDVVKRAKDELLQDKNYYSKTGHAWKGGGVDVECGYWQLNIKGNEEDDTVYYIEKVGDKIIRFQTNDLDDDIIPINVFTLVRRYEYWWGNTDAEYQMPYENYMNLVLQMAADQGMKELESYIFYNGGTIDISKLNDAKKSGGFVNVDWKDENRPISELFYTYQKPASNYTGLQYLMRESKEGAQRLGNSVDYQRSALQGGPQNKTLGAAQMMQQQGDIREGNLFESFGFGLQGLGYCNLTQLQQFLSDQFYVRPKIDKEQELVSKREILGNYSFEVESSLTVNDQEAAVRLQNVITGIENFKATPDPTWQNVNTAELVRSWLKKLTKNDKIDIDIIMPQSAALQQPGYKPSAIPPMQAASPVQEALEKPQPMMAA